MNKQISAQTESDRPYVSTGHLPAPDLVETLVAEAHAKYKSNTEGKNSQVYQHWRDCPPPCSGSAWLKRTIAEFPRLRIINRWRSRQNR